MAGEEEEERQIANEEGQDNEKSGKQNSPEKNEVSGKRICLTPKNEVPFRIWRRGIITTQTAFRQSWFALPYWPK